jgi:hypothetical protein
VAIVAALLVGGSLTENEALWIGAGICALALAGWAAWHQRSRRSR